MSTVKEKEHEIETIVKEHLKDWLDDLGIPHSTTLLERVVRVEEDSKSLREHLDLRFDETRQRFDETKQRFDETRQRFDETNQRINETNQRIEQLRTETKENIEQLRTETKEYIKIHSKGTNRYIALGTAAILAGIAIVGTIFGVLLNVLIQQ